MAARALIVSTTILATVVTSWAQVSGQISSSGSSFSGTASFGAPFGAGPVVTGAPYSGEEVNENVKVLADGTRLTQKMTIRKVWRDAEGRTRTERPLGMGPNQNSMPLIVEVTDPIAGYKYTLDTQAKVAHRQALPAPGSRPTGFMGVGGGGGGRAGGMIPPPVPSQGSAPQGTAPMQPRFSHESIGTQTIDGVMVEGTRNTTTFPVGMMGNDREFSTVSENWISPELKIQILSKTNDPRNGESTFRIQNLSRTQPDPLLFLVPADYTIVDESGGFTIHFGGGK
jgi:hypothetical protein